MIRVSIPGEFNLGMLSMLCSRSSRDGVSSAAAAAGVAVGALVSVAGHAEDSAVPEQRDPLQSIEVTGTAIHVSRDISQSVDTIDKKELQEQNLTLVQEALRNVPGVTLNSGEGGAHGDSVNLRGLSVPDSFFLDGVRDIGQYRRDTFNTEALSVLLGPASAVFGRGSTSGVINSISKQPQLTPLASLSIAAGQADYWRGTGDFNLPLSDTAAARLTVMDQRYGVVQRDQVMYKTWGVAPTLALGIGTPTRLTFSYFKEVENNLPDYGIPFVDGRPAGVDRNNYYGLVNYDRTRTNTNIGTIRFEHDFADELTVSDSLRYANYNFLYLVDGSFLGNDFIDAPPPGTPYSDITVSRDQPSSGGTTSMLINRTDVTLKFDTGGFKNTLVGGLELSKEQSNVNRFQNGLDDIAPTPLLTPNGFGTPATPLIPYSNPKGRGNDVSVYALDSIAFGPHWDLDAGVRFDRFKTSFREDFSGTGFDRTDNFVSPRAAVIYKPTDEQSFYLSYGTSQNPVIEYAIVAPSNDSLSPEKNSTLELGGKVKIMGGAAEFTGSIFDTRVKNVRITDPDDPTVQEAPFDQHVEGVELGVNGYITSIWELAVNYTHMRDKVTASTDPLSIGQNAPNTPHDAANLWTTVEPTTAWTLGGGFTVVSHRFADTENTAGVPGYVVFNAMTSYKFSEHFNVQLNLNNLFDKLYFTGFYYTGTQENHALPSAGRTLIGMANYRF
jgi:catecholate siderophore receptor